MELLYILNGKTPVREPDLLKWGKWLELHDRHVAKTLFGEYQVSTVFLGLDHRHFGEGPPILFETMVFKGPVPTIGEIFSGKDLDHQFSDLQERYSTWEEAEAGHRKIVAKVIREA